MADPWKESQIHSTSKLNAILLVSIENKMQSNTYLLYWLLKILLGSVKVCIKDSLLNSAKENEKVKTEKRNVGIF